MQCPKCQFENRKEAKFCNECGYRFYLTCPDCGQIDPLESKFCSECGCNLESSKEASNEISATESLSQPPSPEKPTKDIAPIDGERKHVTVLFSDLTGYTAMSEKLDPEEVKEITSRIFGEISKIVANYDGFIEKYAGDAVMALFGAEKSHEDDPVRAIRAAREIHKLVKFLSSEYEERIGQRLSMHTGINTGLVVTGEVDFEKGTHGVAGGAINVAARLSDLGEANEILVGEDSFKQAGGHFDFEELVLAKINGKSKPARVYKVIALKTQPLKIHRLHGFRAELIGREVEMDQLADAVQKLQGGYGSILSISGTAGTGKSRLVEDFRSILKLEEVQWLEGYAYPYSQNIPYYPLIDMLTSVFKIEEGDPSERIREKVESGVAYLLGAENKAVVYIGGLFSVPYPEEAEVSPEFWKARLHDSIRELLFALAKRGPTVICFEDLHWADPSFIELLGSLLKSPSHLILFLCVYRPSFCLFDSKNQQDIPSTYHEIRLLDLSTIEAQAMLRSLLKSEDIPSELMDFIEKKAEGNPFYLEEVVNSLIESQILTRENGSWKLIRAIGEADIPSSINGVLAARVDRLQKESKRILQEASVIGRAFFYEILKRVSDLRVPIDQYLAGLEQLDLIRVRSLEPDLEYIFKHALTQEVVYNGLLKKERQTIHERIGFAIEKLFKDRLPEFYEILAFHFEQSRCRLKAVSYLMKSGKKSLQKYAIQEAHQHYQKAFELLSNEPGRTHEEDVFLIDLVIEWAVVFYWRGDAFGLVELLSAHENLTKTLGDPRKLGMFYNWFGYVMFWREKYRLSYKYLNKALKIGERIDSKHVIGYACAWLPYTCAELGLLEEGIDYGEKAQEISRSYEVDKYIYIKSFTGIGNIYFFSGRKTDLLQGANVALEYGTLHSDLRFIGIGYAGTGMGHLLAGNFPLAIEFCLKAVKVSSDPIYSMAFRSLLASSYLSGGNFQEAQDTARKVMAFSRETGVDWLGTMAKMVFAVASIAIGRLNKGFKDMEDIQRAIIKSESKWLYAQSEYILGNIYLQIVQGTAPISLSIIVKNIGSLVKNVPFAGRKAEIHFRKAIESAKQLGAKGILGQAYLDLGLLYKIKKKKDEAKKYLSKAISLFRECEADVYLKKATETLELLR